jgi:hypothetical protein
MIPLPLIGGFRGAASTPWLAVRWRRKTGIASSIPLANASFLAGWANVALGYRLVFFCIFIRAFYPKYYWSRV